MDKNWDGKTDTLRGWATYIRGYGGIITSGPAPSNCVEIADLLVDAADEIDLLRRFEKPKPCPHDDVEVRGSERVGGVTCRLCGAEISFADGMNAMLERLRRAIHQVEAAERGPL